MTTKHIVALAAPVVAASVAFALDVMTPLGVASGVLYLGFVLCGLLARRASVILAYAAIATGLTLVGGLLSAGAWTPAAVANRLLAVSALWALAIALFGYLRRAKDAAYRAAIVEASEDAIFAADMDGVLRSWNRGAEQLYQYSTAEAVGQDVSLLVPEDGAPELEELMSAAGRGESRGLQTLRKRKDGTLVEVWLRVSPICVGGRPVGVSIIARDISRQLQRQRELERSNADLEQFAYAASHDLVEPLRMVESFTQLLAEDYGDQLDARAKEYIHFAVDGASRMRGLIQDLLEFSRVTSRSKNLESVDAAEAVQVALSNLQYSIEQSDGTFDVAELPTVVADRAQLCRLFQNLLGNAIKFRHPERPLHVGVRAEARGDGWALFVTDNGIGIDASYAEQVFQPFKRLHTREEYPGSGMGLALCKRIVERHGGTMWVSAGAEGGCEFAFTLPGADAPAPTNLIAKRRANERRSGRGAEAAVSQLVEHRS